MESVLESVARQWVAEDHLRNVLEGTAWITMYDSDGKPLDGIRGKAGAGATKVDGTNIGVDLIEMQAETRFELHVHDGDHILYIESGSGFVHINGNDIAVKKGDTVFIPGEYPHGVIGPPRGATEPLVIVSFGHPHKHVDAKDRMRHPDDHEH